MKITNIFVINFSFKWKKSFGESILLRLWNNKGETVTLQKEKLPGGNETIMLVDDQDAIWDFMIEALQTLGYSVILAEHGVDAVEIYKNNPGQIDCVILDMIMPKMGGHNTFYQLKALDPKVKVILSSGYVSEQEVDDILKQGAKSFIPKPHRIKDIAIEIRRVLDEK